MIGGSRVYTAIIKARIPFISAAIKLIAEFVWFTLTWLFSIPIPSKVTAYIGRPIYTQSNDDIDTVVKRVNTEFQQLIHQQQPGGRNFTRAYQQWKEHRKQYPNNDYPVIKQKDI